MKDPGKSILHDLNISIDVVIVPQRLYYEVYVWNPLYFLFARILYQRDTSKFGMHEWWEKERKKERIWCGWAWKKKWKKVFADTSSVHIFIFFILISVLLFLSFLFWIHLSSDSQFNSFIHFVSFRSVPFSVDEQITTCTMNQHTS